MAGRMMAKRMATLDVMLAPDLIREDNLKGARCVIIDVLRATTTIVAALANGAQEIIPFASPKDVRPCATSLNTGSYLLGGEEMGKRIPGFDLGNSPLEYASPGAVRGKTILFSTSNGTPALHRVYDASGLPVYIAALVNLAATARTLAREITSGQATKVVIVCSGRNGHPSTEDTLCAGLLVQQIGRALRNNTEYALADSASIARAFADSNRGGEYNVLASSEHGRYLQGIGFASDLGFAAMLDKYDTVPVFDGRSIVLL
jgi:2-phosphosulfolactate phosphatase